MKTKSNEKNKNKVFTVLSIVLVVGLLLVIDSAFFKMHHTMHNSKFDESMDMDHGYMNHETMSNSFSNDGKTATMPGQDAFGAIGEIVELLNNNPDTAWSKVNINALKEHLMDMDLLTTKTNVKETVVNNGMVFEVTSNEKRVVDAIKRMVPTHADMILNTIWETKISNLDNGIILQVTDNKDFIKIQHLGFYGIMAYGGNHHQIHHMALAKGEVIFK